MHGLRIGTCVEGMGQKTFDGAGLFRKPQPQPKGANKRKRKATSGREPSHLTIMQALHAIVATLSTS